MVSSDAAGGSTPPEPPINPYEPQGPPQQPPPYGYQQPYGSEQPYGYGQPVPPRKSGRTAWIVLGVILGAMLLICGGCFAAGALFWDRSKDVFEEAVDRYEPRAIEAGESITISEVTIQPGWQPVAKRRRARIEGLVVVRSTEDNGAFSSQSSISLTFTFYDGATELASVGCTGDVPKGEDVPLDCSPGYGDARAYDRLTVELV